MEKLVKGIDYLFYCDCRKKLCFCIVSDMRCMGLLLYLMHLDDIGRNCKFIYK